MQEYPYFSPVILTDSVFTMYGGQTGTSTSAQRNAAYLLAEEQMTEHLSTFLKPTIITGTYLWRGGNPVELEFGHILNITSVSISDIDWSNSCTVNINTGCAVQRNAEYGYLDVSYLTSCGGCTSIVGYPPYHVTVVYESGLSTGTATQPSILTALTIAAQINLNEMDVSLANESVADIGVQSFSNQSYSETRTPLGHSAFGSSAMAQRAARLVKKYRSKPSIGFH